MTLPNPPPPRSDTGVTLAIAGMVIALLIGVTILAVFAPTLALPMAALIIAMVGSTGIPAVLSLVKAAEAKDAATRVEGKTDAIQVSVDGRISALITSIEAQGKLTAAATGLQATLDEKTAQAGRDAGTALATAAASDTHTTTTTTTTLNSPPTVTVPVAVPPPAAALPLDPAPLTYQPADNYPDGPTPFGPPPSPGTEGH